MIPPRHNLWKKGLYCDKCRVPLITKSKLKLWLWALYHWFKCNSQILLINWEHESIVDGKVRWMKHD